MPLTWDITRCADLSSLQTDAEYPVTETCVFLTVGIGLGNWTEANAAEVFGRIRLMETVYGPMLYKTEDGVRTARPITPADVQRRIGLRTNVGKDETRASFLKRHGASIISDGEWDYRKAERERQKTVEDLADAEITAEGAALAAGGLI